ncbi:serine/threonine protein kinase [Phormidium sp. CCY1219]|uniref:serine/threonine protein kinase n=1 Tax=Phormidium sp. CCY1219 TaxID=2886104 RepID=UPI002D1E73F1|nr:serine/threonine protein kinase [Phormidium sp. CCY1219]MEB3828490.1 serine/threonine protein kinase [Phormidium sp. CCY1219]
MFFYQIYGITLSSNRQLPGLIAISPAPTDIEFELTETGPVVSPQPATGWQINREQKTDGTYELSYGGNGMVEFQISPSRQKISARTNLPLPEVTAILLGAVLGSALRLRGTVCLHSSAIAVGTPGSPRTTKNYDPGSPLSKGGGGGDKGGRGGIKGGGGGIKKRGGTQAIALIGAKGAGKSTTAAAFAKRGCPILADDVAVLTEKDNSFLVQPGYPRLRLWPNAVNAVYGSEVGLSRVMRQIDKRYVELDAENAAVQWRFQAQPASLAAVYILEPRQLELATPAIAPIPSKIGLMMLLEHCYPYFLTLDRDRQYREFIFLGRLAATVPLRKVDRPDELTKLPQICDAILDDIKSF